MHPAPIKRLRARLHRRRPDVTLVLPPFWGIDRPPLHVACLAAYLRGQGLRVQVEDLNVEVYRQLKDVGLGHLWTIGTLEDLKPMALYHLLMDNAEELLEQGIERILSSDTPVIGFCVNSANRHSAGWLARRLRHEAPGRTIVYGGPEVLALLEEGRLSRFCVDQYVLGEGEETLLEITRRALAGGPVGTVPGAIQGPHWDSQAAIPTRWLPRLPLDDLDSIPHPTYEEFDLSGYSSRQTMPFLFSRGCPARCVFCIDCELAPHFRCRSGVHAADEMAYIARRHGRTVFPFNDLICNGDMDRLLDLAQEVRRRRLDVVWSSYAMIHPGLTHHTLALLHAAGCTDLHYGFESGSDAVLRRMRKPYSAGLAQRVIRATAEVGIRAAVNVIVGFPGETEEDFQQTLFFLRNNAGAISSALNVSSMALLRGSALSRDPERWGIDQDQREAWRGADGMCKEVRKERLDRVMSLLVELEIPTELVNCTHEEKVVWH